MSKRDIPYFCIANTSNIMTGGRITHETKARSIGVMSEGVLSCRCKRRAVIRGTTYNLSNSRWHYAELPGTGRIQKNTGRSSCANKMLISLDFMKNLTIEMYSRHANSAEDIIQV